MWLVVLPVHLVDRSERVDALRLEVLGGEPLTIVRPMLLVHRKRGFDAKLGVASLALSASNTFVVRLTKRLIAACLSASSIELL